MEQDFAPLRAHEHLRLAKPASEPQTSMESLRKAAREVSSTPVAGWTSASTLLQDVVLVLAIGLQFRNDASLWTTGVGGGREQY